MAIKMGKRYRGDNRLGRVPPETKPGFTLMVKLEPHQVHYFIAIMQGYTHLGFPVNLNPKEGLIVLHTTPGCFEDLRIIVGDLLAQQFSD